MGIIPELSIAYIIAKTEQSMKMDEQAQKKYAKAFERQAAAVELVKEKQQLAEDTLMKVANRKRAILSTTMNDFLKLYERIIKIDFTAGEGIAELNKNLLAPTNISEIRHMTVTAISPMSDKELVNTFLVEGLKGWLVAGPVGATANALGSLLVKDSERNLSKANSQVKLSNVVYSQAETIVVALDAIAMRSAKIAELLTKMNLLFIQSIKTSTEVIKENGFDRVNYDTNDRKIIMSCINIADAVKKIIDTPLLDKKGELTKESLGALQTGNKYLEKIQQL